MIKSLPGRIFLGILVALVSIHLHYSFLALRQESQVVWSKESLRRLAALTIQNFPEGKIDSPKAFWKAIGREENPMRDPWGHEYLLEAVEGQKGRVDHFWRSAGPDGRLGSKDDISLAVPYPQTSTYDSDSESNSDVRLYLPSTTVR